MVVAIVSVVIVAVLVLAAVMVMLPKAGQEAQSTPESAMSMYLEGAQERNASKMIDSTLMHFDTANRTMFLVLLGAQSTGPIMMNISITGTEEIPMADVPTSIKLDVTNFTTAIQKSYSISVQESQFLKITIKQTNSSTDSYSVTSYMLLSKVDGKWYFDIYVRYSTADWAVDRSMSAKGWGNYPGSVQPTTPIGSLGGTKNNGSWVFTLNSIDSSSVKYSDCMVKLTVGGQSSSAGSISTNTTYSIYLTASTGYTVYFTDSGASGYLSAGDSVKIGPIGGLGINPVPPAGTMVTLTLYYDPTGGVIASGTLIV
jgi:hypothetical protein